MREFVNETNKIFGDELKIILDLFRFDEVDINSSSYTSAEASGKNVT